MISSTSDAPVLPSSHSFLASETQPQQHLRRSRQAAPHFLQGVFPFIGRGLFDLAPLNDDLSYTVPAGKTVHVVYVRGGNYSDDLLYLALSANGSATRYFPIGPKADFHVPLAIVEEHPAGTRLDVCLAAPRGLPGTVIVDVGLIEVAEAAGVKDQL